MHYSLFELERIEKILTAKLAVAREHYAEKEDVVKKEWLNEVQVTTRVVNYTVEAYKELNAAWEKGRQGVNTFGTEHNRNI